MNNLDAPGIARREAQVICLAGHGVPVTNARCTCSISSSERRTHQRSLLQRVVAHRVAEVELVAPVSETLRHGPGTARPSWSHTGLYDVTQVSIACMASRVTLFAFSKAAIHAKARRVRPAAPEEFAGSHAAYIPSAHLRPVLPPLPPLPPEVPLLLTAVPGWPPPRRSWSFR